MSLQLRSNLRTVVKTTDRYVYSDCFANALAMTLLFFAFDLERIEIPRHRCVGENRLGFL